MAASASCCTASCLAVDQCEVGPPQGMGHRAGFHNPHWVSKDPVLASKGIKYLQLGGDTWNRCGPGWLNIDGAFDKGDGAYREDAIFTDDTARHNMKHFITANTRLPFTNSSVQYVYSEHMLEHLLPSNGGQIFLREAWRVLAPGGVMRLVTPDLDKYVCGMVEQPAPGSKDASRFLESHAQRFAPMEESVLWRKPGRPGAVAPTRATIFNNIFRNYGHWWLYNFEELKRLAKSAGIHPRNLCRSDRTGRGLPRWTRQVMRRANAAKNVTQQCWLDQGVREGESMYAVLIKPLVS